MKKGLTLVEVITALVILGILAALAMPNFANMRRRAEFREVASLIDVVVAAARYYDLRSDLANFDFNPTLPAALSLMERRWAEFNITLPPNAVCEYRLVDAGGARAGQVELEVWHGATLFPLYELDLVDGTVTRHNTAPADLHPDNRFLPRNIP
ncbi:type II secretion system protein [Candidatus Omnitrophota bacterium]